MNRIVYLIVLFVPFIVLGSFYPHKFPTHILPYLVIFYIPTVTILRMKYLKYSWKEIFKSFIPFYGVKYRFRVFKKN